MQETLEFDVTLEERPVKLKKNGENKEYVLREFDGASRKNYLADVMGMVNVDVKQNEDDATKPKIGISSIKDPTKISGIKSRLISLCLFTKEEMENENPTPVTAETILTYPTKVIDGLYEACQKLNGLGAGAEAIAKNELPEKPVDG